MTKRVKGFQLVFTSVELDDHLRRRVAHHNERMGFYASRAADLESGGHADAEYTGGDPAKNLRERAESHRAKAIVLEIMADHLIPNAHYELDLGNLKTLEFTDKDPRY